VGTYPVSAFGEVTIVTQNLEERREVIVHDPFVDTTTAQPDLSALFKTTALDVI
jgi:hypothetical protein